MRKMALMGLLSVRECETRDPLTGGGGIPFADLPGLGSRMPKMGRTADRQQRSGLASAILTLTQQRVLGLFFGNPGRTYSSSRN